jgi:general secretion pathway protein E
MASGLRREDVVDWNFKAGKGCGHCRGSGFKGRSAIAEILNLNDEIRELIIASVPIRQLKEAARANGTRYLRDSALDLVKAGRTTLTEINRVTFVA